MNDDTRDEIIKELCIVLDIDETQTEADDYKLLIAKLNNAIRAIKSARNYPANYTSKMIADDLDNYYANIFDLAVYEYNQSGAEGEISHNENGTNRTYKSRRECFVGVIPFAKVLI
jgi:hypothetical protein